MRTMRSICLFRQVTLRCSFVCTHCSLPTVPVTKESGTNPWTKMDDDCSSRSELEDDFNEEKGLNSAGENLSDLETYFNVCNGIMGTGLLAMGFVFRCAGIWGFFIVPIIALAANYTGKILIELLYETTETGQKVRVLEGYLDLGEKLHPCFGRLIVNIINTIENFAHAILILLMAGGVLNEIVPVIADDLWTVFCSILLLAIVFLERIRSLSKIATTTVLTGTILVLIATIYSLNFSRNWPRTIRTATTFSLKNVSLAVGITVVTYACQPYLPFIEKDMRNRDHFKHIMNVSYILVTLLKIVSGFFVYLAYENMTHPMMTLDLPNGPWRTISSLFLLIVALTFFIFPMFTVFHIVDENWPESKDGSPPSMKARYFVRTAILMVAVLIAVVTPHFGLGVALVGNFTANLLVFIIPAVCHIAFNYGDLTYGQLAIDVLIVIVSVVFGTIGIVFSTLELVASFSDEDLNPTEPLQHL